MARIWSDAEGLKVTYFTSETAAAAACSVLLHDGRVGADAAYLDVADTDVDALLPVGGRYFRHCRVKGKKITVDLAGMRLQRLQELRAERNQRLAASDSMLLRSLDLRKDNPMTGKWRAYRQALRDGPTTWDLSKLSAKELEAFQPEWPEMPE